MEIKEGCPARPESLRMVDWLLEPKIRKTDGLGWKGGQTVRQTVPLPPTLTPRGQWRAKELGVELAGEWCICAIQRLLKRISKGAKT